jgi:predicted CXXCH cytochrome family protein
LLLLGAIPALADGGPHQSGFQPHSGPSLSGSSGINSDACASCHRAHTAPSAYLTIGDPDLCLVCHGQSGTGATTDVMNGVQYKSGQAHSATPDQSAILGALRGGGFANARIDTANAGRLTYWRSATDKSQLGVVPVRSSGQAVTSRHMDPTSASAATAWGSGALGSAGAGSSITMECTSCHNPHGNGSYRILNPIPGDGTGPFPEATTGVTVTDLLEPGRLHNYTVIQKLSTTATFSSSGSVTAIGAESGYLLYADQIDGVYQPNVGDYFHRTVPWYGAGQDASHPLVPGVVKNRMNDAPNGHPADTDPSSTVDNSFNAQINAWCSQCHTRYLDGSASAGQDTPGSWGPEGNSSGDAIFTYRHSNTSNKPCTTCHVAHGSNAQMGGAYSSVFPYPNGTTSASSRLLKFDNRGTCQACHDPTGAVDAGTWSPTDSPVPTPVVP